MITAVTTMTNLHDELRDLHAARFAEMAALREMLVIHGSNGNHQLDTATADRMRDTVAEILRLQRAMSLSQE
jgi:ferritin-like metal-binding protein YciE